MLYKTIVWLRLIRFKLLAWLMLFKMIYRYLCVGNVNLSEVQFWFLIVIGKINFMVILEFFDDLIRFPPY
jgi:hypothetical protein